jgi:hypothetical protein
MKTSNMYKELTSGFTLLCVSALLVSCGNEAPKTEEESDIFVMACQPEQEGMFRGVKLGDGFLDVRNEVPEQPVSDADSVLEYHHTIPWKGRDNELVVYYTFDSFGLFEIQADLFLNDKARTDEAFSSFQMHFDSLYGEHSCTGQLCRWTTFSRSNNVVEVTLSNESFDPEHPFLSINFLEPLSNEI